MNYLSKLTCFVLLVTSSPSFSSVSQNYSCIYDDSKIIEACENNKQCLISVNESKDNFVIVVEQIVPMPFNGGAYEESGDLLDALGGDSVIIYSYLNGLIKQCGPEKKVLFMKIYSFQDEKILVFRDRDTFSSSFILSSFDSGDSLEKTIVRIFSIYGYDVKYNYKVD